MIDFAKLVKLRQVFDGVLAFMEAKGVPKSAKLKTVVVLPDGLLFIMEDGSEWTATVALARTK